MRPCKVWIEQCNAARRIDDQFGTDKALEYLVGEKFLNFLEVAETDPEFRTEVPAFATGESTGSGGIDGSGGNRQGQEPIPVFGS